MSNVDASRRRQVVRQCGMYTGKYRKASGENNRRIKQESLRNSWVKLGMMLLILTLRFTWWNQDAIDISEIGYTLS